MCNVTKTISFSTFNSIEIKINFEQGKNKKKNKKIIEKQINLQISFFFKEEEKTFFLSELFSWITKLTVESEQRTKQKHYISSVKSLVSGTKLNHDLIHHVTFILPIISESLDKSWRSCLVIYRQNNIESRDGSRSSPPRPPYVINTV